MESRAWRRRRISDQGFYGLLFLSSPYFRPISRCKVDKERNSWPKSPILSTKGPKFAMLFNAWPKFPILSTEKAANPVRRSFQISIPAIPYSAMGQIAYGR